MTHRSIPAPRALFALALLAVLAGCAIGPQYVRTEVTSYNEWSTLPADRTYTFARTLELRSSLELKTFEEIVRDELAIQGFRLVPDPAQAALIVTLKPSVTGTRVRVRDPWPVDPFWSPYGFYGRRGFGWYDRYGSPFYDFNDFTVDVFHRRLEMDIDSRTTVGKRYYEGRVETSSQAESMKAVIPYMVRALFTDFPGNNGQTRRVDIPVDHR